MFNVHRKKSDSAVQHHQQQQQQQQPANCNLIKENPKFTKCVSLARLFGNAYSTHQHMSRQKTDATPSKARILFKNRNSNLANKLKIERFKNRSESQIEHVGTDCVDFVKTDKLPIEDFCDEKDLSTRAFRTISKGLGLIWRRSYSVEISTPDPEYKVFYLGNVLTGWAKGDNCIEKPLATLWRNYTQINKPDVAMRILVCSSGLKATTRQHGLTEYWANRITYCCSPKNYPRVFCWIYRHEGRKLKHELRCHAVLCSKESIAEEICKTLKENLSQALKEFKRDKINRQNARLSLVNSLYENPSMPRRKILLSVGANNYRPPMERSKSAPKLMAIEEAVGEEEEISSAPSLKKSQSHSPYCKSDLFTSATFDRKYAKRNRLSRELPHTRFHLPATIATNSKSHCIELTPQKSNGNESDKCDTEMSLDRASNDHYDDDDDFHNLLMTNDYDMKSSLSGEILSYFDTKLSNSTSTLDKLEIALHPNGMDMDEFLSNNHQHHHHHHHHQQQQQQQHQDQQQPVSIDTVDFDSFNSIDTDCSIEHNHTIFNENERLNQLAASETKGSDSEIDKSNGNGPNPVNSSKCISNESNFSHSNGNVMVPFILDSDEGSITSGCETSSIITTAHMDDLIKSEREIDAITLSLSRLLPKHLASNLECVSESDKCNSQHDRESALRSNNEEDSEFSDESGFDENNIGKTNNFRCTNRNNTVANNESTSNADANNNIKHSFSPNATKSVGRLRINIPKNAKSIDI